MKVNFDFFVSTRCLLVPATLVMILAGCSSGPMKPQAVSDQTNTHAVAQGIFKQFDANHDGSISQVEYAHATLSLFESLDTNRDNHLRKEEMGSLWDDTAAKRADTNNDKQFSLPEILQDQDSQFKEKDLNHDGYLSREEVETSVQKKIHPGGNQ